MELKEMLKILCEASGVSGSEGEASRAAAELLGRYTDDVSVDSFGNVRGFIGKKGGGKPVVMLEAHIDEIGFIVTYIDDKGFLKVGSCGGTDRRLCAAQTVTVHATGHSPVLTDRVEKLTGVICTLPPHVAEKGDKAMKAEDIAIDVGLDEELAKLKIAPGDRITIDAPFTELLGTRVSCKAIDDRAGAAAILYALELTKDKALPVDIEVLFAAQEEVGNRGAAVAAYDSEAYAAIATDVSFAHTPDAKKEECGEMGKGAMIGVSPALDKRLTDELRQLAEENEIPFQWEIMGGRTGTDADVISVTKGGIRTALLSIPIKYMHTPVEVAELEDIQSVSRIMAAFLSGGERNV